MSEENNLSGLPPDRVLNKDQLIAKMHVEELHEMNQNIKKMDIKNPTTNIWLIPLVSFVINGLNRLAFGVKNEWVIFGIYIIGFFLIGYLGNLYYKEEDKRNDRLMHLLRRVIKKNKDDVDTEALEQILTNSK